MKILFFVSIAGSLAIAVLIALIYSDLEGNSFVFAGLSPDGNRAFWNDYEADKLSMLNLTTKTLSTMKIGARALDWASDSKTILGIEHGHLHDDVAGVYSEPSRFISINPDDQSVLVGPEASFLAQLPNASPLLFGRGLDSGINKTNSGVRDVHHADGAGEIRMLSESFSNVTRFVEAKTSPKGDRLVILGSIPSSPDLLEVYDLDGWERLLSTNEGMRFAFFIGRDSVEHMLTIEAMEIRKYTIRDGGHSHQSLGEGRCDAARLSPDRSTIALGIHRYEGAPLLAIMSVGSLAVEKRISIPRGREIMDLRYTSNGKTIMAICGSGKIWHWDPETNDLRIISRAFSKSGQKWLLGLGLCGIYFIGLHFFRKRIIATNAKGIPLFEPAEFWIRGAIFTELISLVFCLIGPISIFAAALTLLKLFLAGAAVLFYLSAYFLKLRANFKIGFIFTAIVCLGTWFSIWFVGHAVGSV